MSAMLVVAGIWLWLGLVPLLVLGERGQRPRTLLGEFAAGPIGLVLGLTHRPS